MDNNINLIIKKIYKTDKVYFNKENYIDFYKEFEYHNDDIFLMNFTYIYKIILNILNKYKLFFIIFIIIIIIILKKILFII
jgi:hypothetical protein